MPDDEPPLSEFVDGESSDSADSLLREVADISEPSVGSPVGLFPGDVVAQRFVVGGLSGSGGMGAIHRATDLFSREPVAIKVMASTRAGESNRFAREAAILAGLSHPAIVRYLAHGQTEGGAPFLAMEWLEGEDLSQRLARSPLTVKECLAVLRRSCEGVAVAHTFGIVHRDLKPSNVFLVNKEPSLAKVLDFGVARQREEARTLTQSGTMLGTVGYMSPEQAMGPRDVDARADVFALGCVLFECLTGRPAFAGRNAVAVLAKVLREDPPLVSELCPGIGDALAALVARMLAKSPDARPKDAAAVLAAVDALDETCASPATSANPSAGLTQTEQKIASVILAVPRTSATPPSDKRDRLDVELRRVEDLTRPFGAEPVPMRGGRLLVVLAGRGAATDQATQAARCALLLRSLRPDLRVGVATGRTETTERVPVGAAIDRAAALMTGMNDSRVGVALDELTAGLLDPSFDVRREGQHLELVGYLVDGDTTRRLMGKPTPFVGRDKELGLLELTFRECTADGVARAVLVTGPPGQGKSRLRHEFVAKVRAGGEARILSARADPIGAGSAFLLVRQLVRSAVGLREGVPAAEQHTRLREHIAGVCRGPDAARIADFLGELIGASPAERPCPELRAARDDPQMMSVWLRRAFGEWLSAECTVQPLLLTLEDLHWGDLSSLTYLGEALRALEAKPLMVLAMARPEVHSAFPNLWALSETQEVALGRLTPRAAERLVREALGDAVAPESIQRIIERADGNAFYLEELIRRVAEGDGESLPETVLALMQSRLERLEPEARRIVRAASIFGEVFWRGGVATVLGAADGATELDSWLRLLVEEELLAKHGETRFPAETEYGFRHGLVRDAAYAMLTERDRITGHRMAGDWLRLAGEDDALKLADHFENGDDRARAVEWLLRAAQGAANGGNVDGATSCVERGIVCGAAGTDRGLLRLVQAQACGLRGDWRGIVEASREAVALLEPGSSDWLTAVAGQLVGGTFVSDLSLTAGAIQKVLTVPLRNEPSGAYGIALYFAIQGLTYAGEHETAEALLRRAEEIARTTEETDPAFSMWLCNARGYLFLLTDDLGRALAVLAEARVLAERSGLLIGRAMAAYFGIAALCQTGHSLRTEKAVQELIAFCGPGLRTMVDWATYSSAWTRVETGGGIEAIGPIWELLDRTDHRLVTAVRVVIAQALLDAGDAAGAEQQAKLATDGALFPSNQAGAWGRRASIALHFGRPREALDCAERGLEAAPRGAAQSTVSTLRLARACALHALGRTEEARDGIREARARILRIAATLDDLELRASFSNDVLVHARTLALAREWLD